MDKGQHLRLLISAAGGSSANYKVIGLATELQVNLNAATENNSTKDDTDATGGDWDTFDITQKSGEIQFTGLVNVGMDAAAKTFNDMLSGVSDTSVLWEIAAVSGLNNRVVSKTICSGTGKIQGLSVDAQVNQRATYQGTIVTTGPITVGND